ncbi:hypothetical protein LIER_05931 [Lithospermum erythrorhizon]|uniref:Uncharacterized protein n=1 Tax=Lithospermum erythrorhizon TaxID=34254 RepID=A0AAV3P2Y4_LITER
MLVSPCELLVLKDNSVDLEVVACTSSFIGSSRSSSSDLNLERVDVDIPVPFSLLEPMVNSMSWALLRHIEPSPPLVVFLWTSLRLDVVGYEALKVTTWKGWTPLDEVRSSGSPSLLVCVAHDHVFFLPSGKEPPPDPASAWPCLPPSFLRRLSAPPR